MAHGPWPWHDQAMIDDQVVLNVGVPCFRDPWELGSPIGLSRESGKMWIWVLRGSGGQFFYVNSKYGKCHKLRTYILIGISSVDEHVHFPTNRNVFIFMFSRASGNVHDLIKPLSLTLEPPNSSNSI